MSELKEWIASEIEEYDDARLELAEDGRIDCTRVYIKQDVDSAIDELKAEHHKERHEYIKMIAELKQKLEDAQASAYADSVDAGMRERRLRRLLWRAIALFCARSCEYFNGIMSHCLMGQDDLYKRCEEKKNKYLHAMYKCRAKAEEYK